MGQGHSLPAWAKTQSKTIAEPRTVPACYHIACNVGLSVFLLSVWLRERSLHIQLHCSHFRPTQGLRQVET